MKEVEQGAGSARRKSILWGKGMKNKGKARGKKGKAGGQGRRTRPENIPP